MLQSDLDPRAVIDFDIFNDPRFAKDLHDGLDQILQESPGVFFTERNGGHWVVTDPAAIDHVMKTPAVFSSRCMTIPNRPNQPHLIPVSLDPPEHLLYRRLLMTYFEHQAVGQLEPRVKYWADELVTAARAKPRCEFVSAVSSRMPIYVFIELVGLPMDRHEEFRALAHSYLALSGDPHQGEVLAAKIAGVLAEHIQRCTDHPGPDLISRLIAAEFDGRRLTFDELQSISFLLFIAGLDTVTNAMTFGIRHLARDHDLRRTLRARPDLIPQAVEELLRRFAFVNVPRIVAQDTTLNGVPMRAGDLVLVMLSTFGLDPAVTPAPTEVDVTRQRCTHAAFGVGGHLCLGRHLARLELQALYETWLAEIPEFSIDPDYPAPKPRSGFAMSLPELRLRW